MISLMFLAHIEKVGNGFIFLVGRHFCYCLYGCYSVSYFLFSYSDFIRNLTLIIFFLILCFPELLEEGQDLR